jgi:hypothetical protein
MLPSNMLLLNLTPLIHVTFSTPTPDNNSYPNGMVNFMRILTFFALMLALLLGASASGADHQWHWVKATNTIKGWSISQGDADVVIAGDQFRVTLFSEGKTVQSSLKGTIHNEKIAASETVANSDYSGSTYRGTFERKSWNEVAGTTGAESITLSDGWGMIGLTRSIPK